MVVSRRTLLKYGGPPVVVALATLARHELDFYLGERAPHIFYLVSVALVSWLGGAVPGALTLVLGTIAADYFFIAPRGSLGLGKLESTIGLVLYLFTGVILILLAESQRKARHRAERSAGEALERQALLEEEIDRRHRVELEREGLLVEQGRLRAVAEEQSATLASLFDQAPVGIVLYDKDLRHVNANSVAAAIFGRSPPDLIGWTIGEVLLGAVPDPGIAEIEGIFRRTIEAGEPYSVKGWSCGVDRPGRRPVYLDWSVRRVERPAFETVGLLGTAVDVTEDVERQQALALSEERFRFAAEAVDGLIYDADVTTGRVERTRGLFQLLGYRPEEVPPSFDWWIEQIHPDDRVCYLDEAAWRQGAGGRSVNEYRLRHRDGHVLHVVDRSIAASDEAGRVVRYVGCVQDVTERRQAEQALREADRRKDEFLAVLSHEIRNPLASIRNSLRLMKPPDDGVGGAPADSEQERAMAERQVVHLARLVDDLMDVSRITRGRIELRKERVELAPILRRAVGSARSPLEERGHELIVDLPDAPVFLDADPTRLEQVFGNLLSNAIKYTPAGGRIWLSGRVDGGEVAVKVRDTGLGIEPEMLPRVFEMFVQDSHHSGHAQGGLGIGLGLSKDLVERHGGRISVSSRGAGTGSEFEVRLAIVAPEPAEGRPVARNGHAASDVARARKRVLVVDDNEAIAKSLGRILSRLHGQEVRIAHDGPSALELADEFRPEVVLLDIGMPLMDGCEVARKLRQRPEFAETLLVALTGLGQEADRKRSEEAGIDRHLVKPIDPDELGALIAAGPGSGASG